MDLQRVLVLGAAAVLGIAVSWSLAQWLLARIYRD